MGQKRRAWRSSALTSRESWRSTASRNATRRSRARRPFGGVLKVLLEHEPPHLDPLEDPLAGHPGRAERPHLRAARRMPGRSGAPGLGRALGVDGRPHPPRAPAPLRRAVARRQGPLPGRTCRRAWRPFLRGRSRQSVPAAALADVTAVDDLAPTGRCGCVWRDRGSASCTPSATCRSSRPPSPGARVERRARLCASARWAPGPWRLTAWERGRRFA